MILVIEFATLFCVFSQKYLIIRGQAAKNTKEVPRQRKITLTPNMTPPGRTLALRDYIEKPYFSIISTKKRAKKPAKKSQAEIQLSIADFFVSQNGRSSPRPVQYLSQVELFAIHLLYSGVIDSQKFIQSCHLC